MFTKKSLFSRLPRYLAINFIRFQWKANDKVHAKILKRVEYPFELDLFQFCTSELKGKMQVARENLINNAKVVNKSKDKAAAPPPKDKSAFDVDQIEILTNLGVDTSLALDPGCNPSGLYDLAAGILLN